MSRTVSLYEAKTHLSGLVEDAAGGEEIIIAKNGQPRARLLPLPKAARRKPAGAMRVSEIASDFDAIDPAIASLFSGE